MNEEHKTQIALVEPGGICLFNDPNTHAKLSSEPGYVGHPQAPLVTGKAQCGLVTLLGPEGYAGFSPIEDPVQVAIVEALFELKRASLK